MKYILDDLRRMVGAVALALLLMGGVALALLASPRTVRSSAPEIARFRNDDGDANLLASSELTHHVYLPAIFRPSGPRSFRLGYCSVHGDITQYPDIRDLAAGWYVDFGVRTDPAQPLGMEHVQTVRLHQVTECWPNKVRDREECPYVTDVDANYVYTLTAPKTEAGLRSSVEANPGDLWLIGNEMDRYDWGGQNPWNPSIDNPVDQTQGQDEMLPEVYARAYYDLYHLIKDADPTAQVAIGGIIQATPARLGYLDTIWHTYREKYDADMPVDVWNVHNFIFKERCDDFGADIPPGCPAGVCRESEDGVPRCWGKLYTHEEHDSLQIFEDQIRAFRQWMKDHNQRNKPLIVSEYGIVYRDLFLNEQSVRSFMLDTFDYFMTATDPNLGYPADGNRLVQRWAWYSLDDKRVNDYAYLFDPDTHEMTPLGEAFAAYAQSHLDVWGDQVPGYWP